MAAQGEPVIDQSPPLPAAPVEAGKLSYLEGNWNAALLNELLEFPGGRHDDQADICSEVTAIAQMSAAS